MSPQYSQKSAANSVLTSLLLTAALLLPKLTLASETLMIDLTQPEESQNWRATNDNVMGGISKGQFGYSAQTSHFSGELSLANNGGFSSVNREINGLSSNVNAVELEYTGDGRVYQFRLATWSKGSRITYRHEFTTLDGKAQTKVFKLEDFQAVFRGRLISGAPALKAEDIQRVGLLIADKKAGPFKLKVSKIRFLSVGSDSEQ